MSSSDNSTVDSRSFLEQELPFGLHLYAVMIGGAGLFLALIFTAIACCCVWSRKQCMSRLEKKSQAGKSAPVIRGQGCSGYKQRITLHREKEYLFFIESFIIRIYMSRECEVLALFCVSSSFGVMANSQNKCQRVMVSAYSFMHLSPTLSKCNISHFWKQAPLDGFI